MPALPIIDPPLLNTACLWASTRADLEALYTCPYTGAVTTRTACHVTEKFPENSSIHRYTFSSTSKGILPSALEPSTKRETTHPVEPLERDLSDVSSLNTYGYAPLGLCQYVHMAKELEQKHPQIVKPVIFSVTGDSRTVADCWQLLADYHSPTRPWCMEINVGCPNIPGKPPPAYSKQQLLQFLSELRGHIRRHVIETTKDLNTHSEGRENEWKDRISRFRIPIGLKLPPYTYSGQFDDLVAVVKHVNGEGIGTFGLETDQAPNNTTNGENPVSTHVSYRDLMDTPLGRVIVDEAFTNPWPVAFLTATNTLGSSMLMEQGEDGWHSALQSDSADLTSGIGGLAGAALHALALGNVASLKKRLPESVKIIGVGGVSDADGMARMRAAGADAVGVATALGLRGVAVFKDIFADG